MIETSEKKDKLINFTEKEKRIFITVGLPRSGKSTLRRIVMNRNQGIVLISADQLRFQLYGCRWYDEGENFMWSINEHFLKILLQNGNYIFVDETNVYEYARKKIIKLAKKYNYKIYCFHIDTSKELCIERAKKNNDLQMVETINKMNDKYIYPEINEGFDEIIRISNNDYKKIDYNIFEF